MKESKFDGLPRPGPHRPCIFQRFKFMIQSTRAWVKAGDPPPKSQVKSLYLMSFLLMMGFGSLAAWMLAYFRICFYDSVTSLVPLAFIAFLTLTPGIYGLWVSLCCWRRVYGYDWFMIPNYD